METKVESKSSKLRETNRYENLTDKGMIVICSMLRRISCLDHKEGSLVGGGLFFIHGLVEAGNRFSVGFLWRIFTKESPWGRVTLAAWMQEARMHMNYPYLYLDAAHWTGTRFLDKDRGGRGEDFEQDSVRVTLS